MWKHTFILCSSYSISKSKETRHRTQGHTEYTESHRALAVAWYGTRDAWRAPVGTLVSARHFHRESGAASASDYLTHGHHWRSRNTDHQHLRSQLILSLRMLSTLFYLFEKDRLFKAGHSLLYFVYTYWRLQIQQLRRDKHSTLVSKQTSFRLRLLLRRVLVNYASLNTRRITLTGRNVRVWHTLMQQCVCYNWACWTTFPGTCGLAQHADLLI